MYSMRSICNLVFSFKEMIISSQSQKLNTSNAKNTNHKNLFLSSTVFSHLNIFVLCYMLQCFSLLNSAHYQAPKLHSLNLLRLHFLLQCPFYQHLSLLTWIRVIGTSFSYQQNFKPRIPLSHM